jgi:hypothetical protein
MTILYIDDEQFVRRIVEDLPGLEGREVEVCASGGVSLRHIAGDKSYDTHTHRQWFAQGKWT